MDHLLLAALLLVLARLDRGSNSAGTAFKADRERGKRSVGIRKCCRVLGALLNHSAVPWPSRRDAAHGNHRVSRWL